MNNEKVIKELYRVGIKSQKFELYGITQWITDILLNKFDNDLIFEIHNYDIKSDDDVKELFYKQYHSIFKIIYPYCNDMIINIPLRLFNIRLINALLIKQKIKIFTMNSYPMKYQPYDIDIITEMDKEVLNSEVLFLLDDYKDTVEIDFFVTELARDVYSLTSRRRCDEERSQFYWLELCREDPIIREIYGEKIKIYPFKNEMITQRGVNLLFNKDGRYYCFVGGDSYDESFSNDIKYIDLINKARVFKNEECVWEDRGNNTYCLYYLRRYYGIFEEIHTDDTNCPSYAKRITDLPTL